MSTNPNDLEGFSPQKVARVIFSKEPTGPCTNQLLGNNTSDPTYIFEILANILLEGLTIFSGGLENIKMENFSSEHIKALNPWFQSLGFELTVKTFKKDDEDYKDYYCKAVFKDSSNKHFFDYKGIENSYHFLLNGSSLDENREKSNLNELKGIIPNGDTIYTFSFDTYRFN